jgi:hypothetical protein
VANPAEVGAEFIKLLLAPLREYGFLTAPGSDYRVSFSKEIISVSPNLYYNILLKLPRARMPLAGCPVCQRRLGKKSKYEYVLRLIYNSGKDIADNTLKGKGFVIHRSNTLTVKESINHISGKHDLLDIVFDDPLYNPAAVEWLRIFEERDLCWGW